MHCVGGCLLFVVLCVLYIDVRCMLRDVCCVLCIVCCVLCIVDCVLGVRILCSQTNNDVPCFFVAYFISCYYD